MIIAQILQNNNETLYGARRNLMQKASISKLPSVIFYSWINSRRS